MRHKMKTTTSNNHQLRSYERNKLSLDCFYDKRYIHEDSLTSYAHGLQNTKLKQEKQ